MKPVLESRCVVCHACYDAPCQLLLSSYAGRAARRDQGARLRLDPPRGDAADAPVHRRAQHRGVARRGLLLGARPRPRRAPRPRGSAAALHARARPRASVRRGPAAARRRSGSTSTARSPARASGEFDAYAREHPLGGMPYGMAPLRDEELRILAVVGRAGRAAAPGRRRCPRARRRAGRAVGGVPERRLAQAAHHRAAISTSTGSSPTCTSRTSRRARSSASSARGRRRATPIDEIATRAPLRRPGRRARLVSPAADRRRRSCTRRTSSIRSATRSCSACASSSSTATGSRRACPATTPEEASNPFVSLRPDPGALPLPVPARRRAVLHHDLHPRPGVPRPGRRRRDRGSLLRRLPRSRSRPLGHRSRASSRRPTPLLNLPAEHLERPRARASSGSSTATSSAATSTLRESYYDALDPERRGPTLDWIWDGDGKNPNAQLTVFRHFDNATVVRGFVGEIPKTAWVMDYPIFERIYYDLVAGYDVFGNVAHQVATRLYMDHLRMQSENLFLDLPARRPARGDPRLVVRRARPTRSTTRSSTACTALDHGTQIPFTTAGPEGRAARDDPGAQAGPAAGPPDLLNRCAQPPVRPAGRHARSSAASSARCSRSPACSGALVPLLPEVAFLRVRVRSASGERRSRLLAGAQPRAHQRRLHVRRGQAAGARRRHAHRARADTSAATRTSSSRSRPAKIAEFVDGHARAAIRRRSRALRRAATASAAPARASGRRPTGCTPT